MLKVKSSFTKFLFACILVNIMLASKADVNTLYTYDVSKPLLTDASQLSTNSNCANTSSSPGNLIDYNVNTWFHTSWNNEVTGTHYLQWHFTTAQSSVIFTFTGMNWSTAHNSPKNVSIYATNTPTDESSWVKITDLTDLTTDSYSPPANAVSPCINMGATYTDMRMYVNETTTGNKDNNQVQFFCLSEFQVYKAIKCNFDTTHPLITSGSQLSATANCSRDDSKLEYLIDTDVNTFFHSSWGDDAPAKAHLQWHLNEPQSSIIFTFSGMTWGDAHNSPKNVTLYATNTPTNEDSWKEITQLSNLTDDNIPSHAISPYIDLGAEYTDMRIVIDATTTGTKYFCLSEFQVYKPVYTYDTTNPLITNASQLSSSLNCGLSSSSLSNLLDGNVKTWFHSSWDSERPNPPYLQWHFNQSLSDFFITMNGMDWSSAHHTPKDVTFYATNTPSDDASWVEITTHRLIMDHDFTADGATPSYVLPDYISLGASYTDVRMMVKSTCTGNDFFCLSEFQTYKPTTPEYARLTTLLATITAQSFPTGTTPHTYDADKVATLNQAIIASQAATIDYPAATLNTLYNNLTTAYNDVLASLVRFDGYYYIVNKDLSNEKAIYSDLGLTLKWNSLQSDDAKYVFHITPLPSGNYSIQNLYNEAYVGTVSNQSTAFPLTETLETEQTFTRLSEGVWRIASSTYNIGYHAQDWAGGVGGNVIAWELTTEYGSLGTYPYSKWELRAVSDADLANIIAKRDAERSTGCLALVFIGNSITQGVGVSNATTEAAPIVTGRLIETYSGKNVAIKNCGHSGSTTLDWMPGTTYYNEAIAAAEAIKRYGSLWFSIMLGTNDSAEDGPNGSPVSTDNYKANLKSIIDALLTKYEDAKVVINYPIWYSDNTHNGAVYKAEGLARLQSYHPIITTLVAEYQAAGKAVYAGSTKAYSYFEGNTSLYSAENGNSGTFYLHPNTQGATKLAQFWAGSILGHNIATATGTAIELSMNGSVDANTLKAAIEAATNEATTAVDLSGLTLGSDVEAIDIEQEGNTLVYLASTSSVTGKNIVVGTTCSNLVLTDGYSFAAPRGFTATTASYNRIMSGEWGTVCLPFAVTSDDNIEYYTITGITGSDDNKAIVVEKVEGVLAAGTPALVRKVNGEGLAVSVSNVAVDGLIKDVSSTVNMIGSFTYDNKILKENHPNAYYIKNDKFYHIKNNFYCDAFRAYFEDASPNLSGAFSIIINDDLTAMKPTVTGDSTEIVAIYGADGTKRAAMQKGMNIVKFSNGETQKIMVN